MQRSEWLVECGSAVAWIQQPVIIRFGSAPSYWAAWDVYVIFPVLYSSRKYSHKVLCQVTTWPKTFHSFFFTVYHIWSIRLFCAFQSWSFQTCIPHTTINFILWCFHETEGLPWPTLYYELKSSSSVNYDAQIDNVSLNNSQTKSLSWHGAFRGKKISPILIVSMR